MEITKVLADLRLEREQIEQAIQSLQRLQIGNTPQPKRRGRPPGSKNKKAKEKTQQSAAGVARPPA